MAAIREAFDATVVASGDLIGPSDAALVATGRGLADELDYAIENLAGQERTKALYLTPHLMNVLKEMLATPAARKAVGMSGGKEEPSGSKVGKFRSVAGGKAS